MTDTFFILLRSGLYGNEIQLAELPKEIAWGEILDMATKQTVTGLIADAVSRLPEAARPPQDVQDRLQDFAKRNVVSHLLLNKTLAHTASLLQRNGSTPVLLKGQGIAQCYRMAELRQCGDIDLYVGPKDYKRICALAERELHNSQEPTLESGKHFHLHHGAVAIELHRRAAEMFVPWHNARLQHWTREQLEGSQPLRHAAFFGVDVALPPVNFDALYIFIHLQHHFLTGGIGLRQLCDWAMLLHKYNDEIDRDALLALLRRLDLLGLWQAFGQVAVSRLGLPAHEMPFYSADASLPSDKILQVIMTGGNFGFYSPIMVENKMQHSLLVRKLISLWEHTRALPRMFRFAPSEVCAMYLHTLVLGTYIAMIQLFERKGER